MKNKYTSYLQYINITVYNNYTISRRRRLYLAGDVQCTKFILLYIYIGCAYYEYYYMDIGHYNMCIFICHVGTYLCMFFCVSKTWPASGGSRTWFSIV